MAKTKRVKVGSVCKRKDGSGKYIKVGNRDVVLKADSYLNLESKSEQLASLEGALNNGVISSENAEKARARIEEIPDFVLGEIFQIEKL